MKRSLSLLSALILMCSVGLMGCNGSGEDGGSYTIKSFNSGIGNWNISWDEAIVPRYTDPDDPDSDATIGAVLQGKFSYASGTQDMFGLLYVDSPLSDFVADSECSEVATHLNLQKWRLITMDTQNDYYVMLYLPPGKGVFTAVYCILTPGPTWTVGTTQVKVQ